MSTCGAKISDFGAVVYRRSTNSNDAHPGTLRNYAQEMLAKAYGHAVEQAAIETDLAESAFPSENPRSLEEWLSRENLEE